MPADAITLEFEDPSSQAAQECLRQYYTELSQRFEGGFDPAHASYANAAEFTPPQGYFLVAWLNGHAVGCGALSCHTAFAEIKRMWVDPSVRGKGLSKRILARLEAIALEQGYTVVRLDTNKALAEAHRLYASNGYKDIERYSDNPYAHRWFEKVLK